MNDHFFQQAVSCPLKIGFLLQERDLFSSRPVYRQRNKLNLRDAAAIQFPNLKHTSNHAAEAAEETQRWLREDQVAVCGAVIRTGQWITRIPILVKEGNRFTIIQIHGKLRKPNERARIDDAGSNRATANYLLRAAYRSEVTALAYPDADISVEFFFPAKNFRSTIEGLNRFRFYEMEKQEEIKTDLVQLFSKVDATRGTEMVRAAIPENVSHELYKNRSVKEALSLMNGFVNNPGKILIKQHEGCKWCDYRKDVDENSGCWQKHFANPDLKHPEKHIFELMGQGNRTQFENGTFYQEKADITDGLTSVNQIKKYGGPSFSIQQRRNLQILHAKEEPIPRLWIKQGMNIIRELIYPLHFIDFEAATYALPLQKGNRPYEPVYFQFSCHTLHKDGTLAHTEWIDLEEKNADPHVQFAERFSSIRDIEKGTLIQFSPFEKQAINHLIKEFEGRRDNHSNLAEKLSGIRQGSGARTPLRFFDLNECIKTYYYNCYLDEGLGLKQVLKSIIKWEKNTENNYPEWMPTGQKNMKPDDMAQLTDAYVKIQDNGSAILDGSSAMNAWLAMKNGLLTPDEVRYIPGVLKKYCALDTYAMVMVVRHLARFVKNDFRDDLVIF